MLSTNFVTKSLMSIIVNEIFVVLMKKDYFNKFFELTSNVDVSKNFVNFFVTRLFKFSNMIQILIQILSIFVRS